MLNEKKIRIMTKLALYEDQEKEDLKIDNYYRIDYIRYEVIKAVLSVTVGYLLVLACVIGYRLEDILENIAAIDLKAYIIYAIGLYVLVIVFYGSISGIISYFKYEKSMKNLKKYKKNLKSLRLLYKEESTAK